MTAADKVASAQAIVKAQNDLQIADKNYSAAYTAAARAQADAEAKLEALKEAQTAFAEALAILEPSDALRSKQAL